MLVQIFLFLVTPLASPFLPAVTVVPNQHSRVTRRVKGANRLRDVLID